MFPEHCKSGAFTGIGKIKSDTFHPYSPAVPAILLHAGEKRMNFPKRKFRQRETRLTWRLKLFKGIKY